MNFVSYLKDKKKRKCVVYIFLLILPAIFFLGTMFPLVNFYTKIQHIHRRSLAQNYRLLPLLYGYACILNSILIAVKYYWFVNKTDCDLSNWLPQRFMPEIESGKWWYLFLKGLFWIYIQLLIDYIIPHGSYY